MVCWGFICSPPKSLFAFRFIIECIETLFIDAELSALIAAELLRIRIRALGKPGLA